MQKVILVTGATDGIGKATAIALVRMGAHVLVHGRDEARCRAAVAEARTAAPAARVDWAPADLASMRQTGELAKFIVDNYDRLDAVIHNAGVLCKTRSVSQDGVELTLAVNHIAPFVLTQGLQGLLQRTAAAHGEARVVTVASNVHLRAQIDLDDLNSNRGYNATAVYGMSKLANVLFSNALARRLAGSGVASNSLHPGVITTKLLMAGYNMTGASVDEGAKTSVHVATAPELRGITGRYFDNSRERAASPIANDVAVQDALWAATEKLTASRI